MKEILTYIILVCIAFASIVLAWNMAIFLIGSIQANWKSRQIRRELRKLSKKK